MKFTNNKTSQKKIKAIAINEIIILILSTIAFSYFIGAGLPIVSGDGGAGGTTTPIVSGDGGAGGTTTPILPVSDGALVKIAESATATPATAKVAKTPFLKSVGNWLGGAATDTLNFIGANYLTILGAAGITFGIAYLIAKAYGMDENRAVDRAARFGVSAGAGATAALIAAAVIPGIGWAIAIGGVVAYFIYSILERHRDRQMDFVCKPWQPVTGGAKCQECNAGLFPCTEYQCKSLGVACEIINKDTSDQECEWKNRLDTNSPQITPWSNALIEGYKYEPIPAVRGVEIKYTGSSDKCIPAHTPFSFGVELDKNGYCKIEMQRTGNFSDMKFDFGNLNSYIKQHKQWISFPGVVHLEEEARRRAINISVGNEYEFYVRCESSNGVTNREEFLFRFCIDDGPDPTAPEMLGFNWKDNAPVAWFNETQAREVSIQLYTKEPSQCKWDWEDKSYEEMVNNLTSSSISGNFNEQLSFTNAGRLSGLINAQPNKFYFRCKDYFNNTNAQSKVLTLIGTEALYISKLEPNNKTIRGGTSPLKVTLDVETSAGFDHGKAVCGYRDKNSGISGPYVQFTETGTHAHKTNLWFQNPGNYSYYVRCYDLAGNSDTKEISFEVELDTYAPVVVRAFREAQNLKIITNENASCVYGAFSCEYDFDKGINMNSNGKFHTTTWDPNKNLYIKCMDEFGNRPIPNYCSIVVRPFEV